MDSSVSTKEQKICVRDIMTNQVISVDISASIIDASKMMEDAKVGCIIVMEDSVPVGIITDRDIAIKVASHAYPLDTPIRRIMSSPLIHIEPGDSIWEISNLLHTNNIRKLPVIDEEKLVGIVTSTDLVKRFAVCTEEEMKKMYHFALVKIFDHYNPYL